MRQSDVKFIKCDKSLIDHQEEEEEDFDDRKKNQSMFKWNFNGFEDANAPLLLLLCLKHRKWRNWSHLVEILPTDQRNLYQISFVGLECL